MFCYSDCKGYPDTAFCNVVGLCWCLDGLILVPIGDDIYCLPIATEIGEECRVDVQCQRGVPGTLSGCFPSYDDPENLICNCTTDAIHQPPDHRCYSKASLIGDECTVNAQCTANLGELGDCNNATKKCSCRVGGTSNSNGTYCLKTATLIGEECKEPQQCQHGVPGALSDCLPSENDPRLSVCRCTEEAVNEIGEHVCRKKAMSVGDPCLRNAQCKANLGNLSECLLGETCVCTPYYGVPSFIGDRCLAVVNFIGGECDEMQQCTSGTPGKYSDCVESPYIPGQRVCNCTEGTDHLPGRHECIKPLISIGQPCVNDEQCAGEPETSSACSVTTRLCSCLGGYIPSEQNDDCLPILNRIGDTCALPQQCQRGILGPLSNCNQTTHTCSCTDFAVNEPGQPFCHRRATLVGDACQVNSQCQANIGEYSHCVAETCECMKYAVPSSDKYKCIVEL